MQTVTFTQRLRRPGRFFSSLLPLLALFVGLGSSQTALAQTLSGSNFFIHNTAGAPTVNTTYGGSSGATPQFNNANLGTFDINAKNALDLNGGEIVVTAATAPTSVTLYYQVFNNTTFVNVTPITSINLPLVVTGTGTFTYRETAALRDLVATVSASGNYGVDVHIEEQTGRTIVAEPIRTAFFTVTGTPIAATNIGKSNVFINTTGATAPNTTYGASSGAIPLFQGANLGTYDINTGKLILNGGNATTFESGGDVVQNARLIFQIVKPAQNGQAAIIFAPSFIALTQASVSTDANGNTTRTFSNAAALRNLISGLANSGIGTFNIAVSFEASVLTAAGSVKTIRDDNAGTSYVASFNTTGIPIQTDTWQGLVNDDWFNPNNWDLKRIPDAITNVVVPDFGSNTLNVYPNINAGVSFKASNGVIVDNTASGPALSRDVDLQGTTQLQRSIARLINGRWKVFGSFNNFLDSYIQRAGGTVMEFAGAGNQTISGGSFTELELSGGGTKTLTVVMRIAIRMEFLKNAGLLLTDVSNPDGNFVELAGRSVDEPNGAQLKGETDTLTDPTTTIDSYVRGFVRTTRTDVRANEVDALGNPDPRTFGNIGITLLFTGANNPGDILITRNTAESYTPVSKTSGTERFGIRRVFGVRPSSPNTNTGGLRAILTFHYLDKELIMLGTANPPTGSVSEPNLALFVSTTSGNTFGFLGRDALDTNTNILTKNNVTTFATFTLGDITAPLPVTLTGFDAKRVGADALVTWETASEQTNKGFDVQVSTNGTEFRSLAFVPSASPNSTSLRSYSYTDTEKNKAGLRYYRLRQVDVDGKETFFAPRTVSFEGKALESVLTAYPNPFNGNERFRLNLQSSMSGKGQFRITDLTGRTVVRQQTVELSLGNNDISVDGTNDLKAGIYLVNFTLPTGAVKNLKVVKQ